MGSLTSRQNVGVEEVDIASNHAYKYPPRCGNYFGSHFIMGGERFDTPQPEAYLFGENVDLNFLGSRPTPGIPQNLSGELVILIGFGMLPSSGLSTLQVIPQFPYPPPQANEPTKTLKSLINIRKESVRFVRSPDSVLNASFAEDEPKDNKFNVEFTFDSDCKCAITIYYFCTEEVTSVGLVYTSKDPSLNSQTFHYKRGSNQQFSQPIHMFDPSKYSEDDLSYDLDKEVVPVAIQCVAEEGSEGEPRQSHTTVSVVDRQPDGTYVLRALKQKLYVDGLCYLLQEIYGIENKNNENIKAVSDEDTDDNGSECVICMCDVRDTLILPCRHLCLCNSCADSLRYQANNCPICRAPFRALLQIRALHKATNSASNPALHPEGTCEHIPAGYEAVSLIEALNGPCTLRPPPCHDAVETPNSDSAVHAAELLNRASNLEDAKKCSSESGSTTRINMAACSTPEFRMSVLMSREEGVKSSPVLNRRGSNKSGKLRDTRLDREDVEEEEEDDVEKVATEPDQCVDGDSDAEKLSPLLVVKRCEPVLQETSLANHEGSTQDMEKKVRADAEVGGDRGEDSDYYTPEDPAPTILSPLYESDKDQDPPVPSSVESTPGRWAHARDGNSGVSLPGTPLSTSSHMSARSSGDSYSSSSSTRHLLAHNLAAKQEKVSNSHQI